MGCGASHATISRVGEEQKIFENNEMNPPAGPKPPSRANDVYDPCLLHATADDVFPPSLHGTKAGVTLQDPQESSPPTVKPPIFNKRQQDADKRASFRKSSSRVTISSTGPYMNILEEKFPGSVPEDFFIEQATEILERHGFTASNAINLVSTCRDEICRTFTLELDRLWGPSFSISSLAGMVFCGRTGFKAAMAHSPVIGGKERYVFWVMPHIGLSSDGHFGRCGFLASTRTRAPLPFRPAFVLQTALAPPLGAARQGVSAGARAPIERVRGPHGHRQGARGPAPSPPPRLSPSVDPP